jgi:hypothetical protein
MAPCLVVKKNAQNEICASRHHQPGNVMTTMKAARLQDDGAQVLLRQHEVAVQHGNRHAWRNLGDRPATMLFVLVSTRRAGGQG